MSTDYLTDLPIRITELDSLKAKDISIKADERGCILTLRSAHLHVLSASSYSPVVFSPYGENDPSEIFQLIEEEYGVEIISECDDEYEWLSEAAEKRSKEAKCCPSCSSEDIAEILRGMPGMSKGMGRALDSKQIVLGGCCIEEGQPEWHCNECEREWGCCH